jgi:RHS repeat-associated protein
LARAAVAVLAVAVLVAVAFVYFSDREGGTAYALCCSITPPVPEPGSARPWEVEIPVSTYSSVHARHGNLLTVIPLIGWSGRGPDMGMALFHNAANVNSPLDLTGGMGFDLGPGWTVSYSRQIIPDDPANPTTMTVIADDGAQDVYAWDGVQWVAPLGVHDLLTGDPDLRTGPTFRVTHKDQSYDEYGTLPYVLHISRIVDAAGNVFSINYENYVDPQGVPKARIATVGDAAARVLEFEYDGGTDRLLKIKDPRHADDPGLGSTLSPDPREWTFAYDTNERLATITDPMGYINSITYDADGRIWTLSDKVGANVYTYTYDAAGHLETVTDPGGAPWLTQSFLLQSFDPDYDGDGLTRMKYTDRRGNVWEYWHHSADDWSVLFPDGNLLAYETPLVEGVSMHGDYEHDSDRNVTAFVDGRYNRWEFTYDAAGNMLTMTTDPPGLNLVQTWRYDTYNNVTSYIDAANNTVQFRYEAAIAFCSPGFPDPCATCSGGSNPGAECGSDVDCDGGTCVVDDSVCKFCLTSGETCTTDADCGEGDYCVGSCEVTVYPTLLTSIVEPADGQGNPAATTALRYYLNGDALRCRAGSAPSSCGQLKEVFDPNGVRTGFDYDQWGQPSVYEEGEDPMGGPDGVFHCEFTYDSGGRMTRSACSPGGEASHDDNDRTTSVECIPSAQGASAFPPPAGFPSLPSPPSLPLRWAEWSVPCNNLHDGSFCSGYSPDGEVLEMNVTLYALGAGADARDSYADYDELGRLIAGSVTSDESGAGITRGFVYSYDDAAGTSSRTGPDGVATFVALDEANRVEFVRRGPLNNPIMTADYTYYANGLLHYVTYGNYASTWYMYDRALRVTSIEHRNAIGQTILKLEYAYTPNSLVAGITESDIEGTAATTTFAYDNRGRLIEEVRDDNDNPGASYNLTYEYDQGGNRTKKIDTRGAFDIVEVTYTYDYEDPLTYGSDNNRLEKYTTCRRMGEMMGPMGPMAPGGGGGGPCTPLSTTYYYYNEVGNVTNVVTDKANPLIGEPRYQATRLEYAANGRAVTYALGETWGNEQQHEITYAREFRYDQARQRYLNRDLDPVTLEPTLSTWSDYDGNSVYGDFTEDGAGNVTNTMSFEPGIARVDPWVSIGATGTTYYHPDMIGTTRHMTDTGGSGVNFGTYTAFGEQVSGSARRYGYAGAWGYQTDPSFPFLHVGARYYDPATGRFLQRDPIGIRGGLNVYSYVRNNPGRSVDPSGLGKKWDWVKKKAKRTWEVLKRLPGYVLPSPPIPADVAPGIAELIMYDRKRKHIVEDHDDGTEDPKCPTCKRLTPKKRRRKGPPIIGCGAHSG